MDKPKIILKNDKVLIQPTQEASSSFSIEQRKYDRRSIGIIKLTSKTSSYEEGDTIIYDDKDSIDFTLEGSPLSIIDEYDIVAVIKGGK